MCDKGAIPTEDLTDESSMIGNPNFEDIPSDEQVILFNEDFL